MFRKLERTVASAVVSGAVLMVAPSQTSMAALYWDQNGATPGFAGNSGATNDWSSPNWGTSSAGDVATGLWADGNSANFVT